MYIYRTTIYKNTANVANFSASNDADKVDFETNFKAQAILVTEIVIAETAFVTDLTYASFKTKVTLWTDVKFIEDSLKYSLNLVSQNPI